MTGQVAYVSLTSVHGATYTVAHCQCGRRVMDMPGVVNAEVRMCGHDPSGDGPVITCPRCKNLCEVVEHG